jgi:F-type H+-transporting ATPase subunit delta|tara:strand:+ start:30097 stop:30633 length:537 start_codon:yes stop_codon:yes gene_type:complete
MAELSTLARPYAKAAFEFARDNDALAQWSKTLSLAAQITQQQQVAQLLSSPSLTSGQMAETFGGLLGDDLTTKAANFIGALAMNKRLLLLPYISEQFQALKAQQEQTVNVEVTSAFELSEAEAAQLTKALSANLSREVNLSSTVDTNLIGGVVVRAGDMVIDGSVRNKLAQLTDAMSH